MKKKILLMLVIVSALTCLFAISASATNVGGIYYSFGGTEENPTATVNSNNVNCALEVVNIPETVEYNGKVYTVTALAQNAFSGDNPKWAGNTTVKEVTVPKTVSSIGEHCFRNCTALEKITVLSSSGAYGLTNAEFYGCSSLKEVDFSKATSITSLGAYTFHNCSELKTVKLGEGLTTIGGSFKGCSKLENVTLPSTLKSITGKQAFLQGAFTSIALPKGLETLGNNIFQSSKLTSIILPSTLTTVGEHAFNSTSSLKFAVIANPDVSGYNSLMFYGSALQLIFYAGDAEQAEALKTKFSGKSFTNLVSYEDYLKNPNPDSYTSTIVYGTVNCPACSDIDTVPTTSCLSGFVCEACSYSEAGKSEHSFVKTLVYESGFTGAGVYNCDCTNAGCTDEDKTNVEAKPMFTALGYSLSDDRSALCAGYSVERDMLKLYKEIYGNESISFGIAVVNANGFGDSTTFFDEEYNLNSKGVKVDIDSISYSTISCKVCDFGDNESSLELIFTMYVIDENGDIEFIQSENDYAPSATVGTLSLDKVTLALIKEKIPE